MNKRIIQLWLCGAILVAGSVWAGPSTGGDILQDERFAEARAMMQAGRDEIIATDMDLTEAESERFWPLYREYRAEIMTVRERYAALIAKFMKAYDDGEISDEFAAALLDDWMDYRKDLLKVQQRFVGKFRKVLPDRQVVRFYQLENKMDAEIEAELAAFVPLMEPF